MAEKSAKTGTTGTTLTWLFSNLEGTVDVQTVANATGVTTRVLRDPYGAPIGGSNGVWSSGTGYMNKPVTASTGLTTVGARTYDPVLGKFLSVDPVIDTNIPQQNTGYTYSGNNPTTYMDPSGMRFEIDCGVRCSAAIKNAVKPKSGSPGVTTSSGRQSCKWGSVGCRGASSPRANDGVSSGGVNPCRAFNSTKCENKDAWVNPIVPIKGFGPKVDSMVTNRFFRGLANLPATAVAAASVLMAGGKCGYSSGHGLFVCEGSPLAQQGGTTVGDVFLTKTEPVSVVLNGSADSEALLSHETRHAAQWAGHGNLLYPVLYGVEALKSTVLTGSYGCANWFEFDAGLHEGGYSSC